MLDFGGEVDGQWVELEGLGQGFTLNEDGQNPLGYVLRDGEDVIPARPVQSSNTTDIGRVAEAEKSQTQAENSGDYRKLS